MPLLTTLLRVPVFEADPLQAGLQVDFEQREADPSKYSITQNLHPPEDEIDGAPAPYDGTQMGGMPGGEGGMPGQPPADEEMQPIQPGMQQPGQQMPPMQEGFMAHDYFDEFLDDILEGVNDPLTEAPYPDWAQRGNAPQNYAGFNGPQQAPPSIAAGGPAAIQNWQRQMQAVGGGNAGAVRPPSGGSRPPSAARPPSGGGRAPLPPVGGGRADSLIGGGRPGAPVVQAANRPPATPTSSAMGSNAAADFGALRGAGLGLNRPGVPDFTPGRAARLGGAPGTPGGPAAAGTPGAGRVSEPFQDRIERRLGNSGQTGANRPAWAGNAPNGQTPGSNPGSFDDRVERRLGNSGQTGANRPGWAGNAPAGGAPAAGAPGAAAGAEEGGVSGALRGAGSFIGRNAATAARIGGRAIPGVAGGIAGGEDYARTGNLGHAATVGTGTGLGTAGGAAGGAWLGGAIGALGGPAAPITIPLGAAIGGAAGGYFGSKGGEAAGRAVADTAFGPGNKPPQTAQAAPAAPNPAAARAQVNQPPPATNTRFYQQNPGMRPPAGITDQQYRNMPAPMQNAIAPGYVPRTPAAAPTPTPAAAAQSGPNLVPGGALRSSPSPASAAQSGGGAPAAGGPNLVPGGALSTPQSQPIKDWAMTWRDFMMLHEADQKKSRY